MAAPLIGMGAVLARVPHWLACTPETPAARAHERAAFAALARHFGVALEVAGRPAPGTALLVANHISLADIAVLGAVTDSAFVAKAEVARWPLLGAMARRLGTVFVERGARGGAQAQADAIRAKLRAGRRVLLFPEGTTSLGTNVLPFRSSLFAAADAADTVQPVAITYLARDGRPLTPARRREIAWIDDDGLFEGLRGLARSPVLARVEFLAPLSPLLDRKLLAALARESIRAAQAAAPNRSRYRAEIASTGTTRNTSTVLNW